MLPEPATCTLIHDSRARAVPMLVRQYARLRGLIEREWDLAAGEGAPADLSPARRSLFALDGPTLTRLSSRQADRLYGMVRRGATLYVRGGFEVDRAFTFQSQIALAFRVPPITNARSYRFTGAELVPSVLRDESAQGHFDLPRARGLAEPVISLLEAAGDAVAFAAPIAEGIVIFDLQDDALPPATVNAPILERLGVAALRARELSALIAVERACARDLGRAPAFDIVLDDRPTNFDFFCAAQLDRWLKHVASSMPDAHVDFAWVPAMTHPTRSYIETATRFNVGFVWHGLDRHIDHGGPIDAAAEFEHGRRHLDEIRDRYHVDFQPIVIFPFERHSPPVIEAARKAGFLASFENPFTQPDHELALPSYLRMSTPMQPMYGDYFPIFRRFAVRVMDRGRMLALGALGMPIIATIHPPDIGMRRFAWRSRRAAGGESDLDLALRFAAEKSFRPMRLADIAREMMA